MQRHSVQVQVVRPNPTASASAVVASVVVTPLAKASRPSSFAAAASANAAASARSRASAAVAAAPQPTPTQPVVQTQREAAPVAVPHSNGAGPSANGQVCADKVFIFRIACVAEQCQSDRFRQTTECIRFKEMEKKREETQMR